MKNYFELYFGCKHFFCEEIIEALHDVMRVNPLYLSVCRLGHRRNGVDIAFSSFYRDDMDGDALGLCIFTTFLVEPRDILLAT